MKNKIAIMFFIDQFHQGGGTEKHLTQLVTYLDKRKFRCIVIVFDLLENPLLKKIRESGTPVLHIPVGRFYTLEAVKKAFIISKIIKQNQIDIVQTFHFKSDVYGAIVSRLSGVKDIISSKRDTGDLKGERHFFLNRWVNRVIKYYIAVAEEIAKIVSIKEKIPFEKFRTIYNGVDMKRFQPLAGHSKIELRKELGFSCSEFLVGSIAWLRPEKGHDNLLRGVAKARKDIKELKLVIVGGGNLLDYYEDYAKKLGLSNCVRFVGFTEDVSKYLKIFDVACLVPKKNEGFSNSILEKMATGLPLIVTDIGGNAEAVIDGYNGFLIRSDVPDAICEALINLYKNPKKRILMGDNSRRRVENLFSLEKMIASHEDYYQQILRKGISDCILDS